NNKGQVLFILKDIYWTKVQGCVKQKKKQLSILYRQLLLFKILYIEYHHSSYIVLEHHYFIDSNCYPLLAPRPPRLDSVCFFKEAKRSSESLRKRFILASNDSFLSLALFWRTGLSFAFLIDKPILPSF